MGGPAFRAEYWKAVALTAALLPLATLDVSLARAEQQILDMSVSAFLTDPPEILRENPKGGSRLTVEIRDLALSDPSTLKPILTLIPQANDVQQIAIGTGLAQAAKIAMRTRPAYSNEIQQVVAQTNERVVILSYDTALAKGVSAGHAPDGSLLPEANGVLVGPTVGSTTGTAPLQTGQPAPTIPQSEVVVPPSEVVAPAPEVVGPGLSTPAEVPQPVPASLEALPVAVPSPVVQSSLVSTPITQLTESSVISTPITQVTSVSTPVTQLMEAVEPTIPIVPAPLVVSTAPLSLPSEPNAISESVSPSR